MRQQITVIIPVYNVENYLNRCVASIRNQTYKNLDIILVDDGSTDLSGKVCDELALCDERIRVIHKENGGLSSARNVGIKAALSDYYVFVDSDDFVHHQMIEILWESMQHTGADISICDYVTVEEKNLSDIQEQYISLSDVKYDCYVDTDIMRQLILRDCQTVVQWNKLFKKKIFNNLLYPEGRIHEDEYVIHRQLYAAKKITYVDTKLYYYVRRSGSIMKTETHKSISDAIDGYLSRIAFFEENQLVEEYNEAVALLLRYIDWRFVIEIIHNKRRSVESEWLYNVYIHNKERFAINSNDSQKYGGIIVANSQKSYTRKVLKNHRKDLFFKNMIYIKEAIFNK